MTSKFLNLLSDNNVLWLSGHDHILSSSLIFPQGASEDKSKHINYNQYENPEDNIGKESLEKAFSSAPIQQIIVGSCSQKHYEITSFYEKKYEVPVYTLATARDAGKVSVFAACSVIGDLLEVDILGNEHDFGFRWF